MIAECEADEKDGKGGGNKVQRGPKVSQQIQFLLAWLITICLKDCNTSIINPVSSIFLNLYDTKLFLLVKKRNDGNNTQVYPKNIKHKGWRCLQTLTQKN